MRLQAPPSRFGRADDAPPRRADDAPPRRAAAAAAASQPSFRAELLGDGVYGVVPSDESELELEGECRGEGGGSG